MRRADTQQPLHVVYVCLPGTGIETYAREMAAAVTALGHTASILYQYHSPPGKGETAEDIGRHESFFGDAGPDEPAVAFAAPSRMHWYYHRVLLSLPNGVRRMLPSSLWIKGLDAAVAFRRALLCIKRRCGPIDIIELPEGMGIPAIFLRGAPPRVVKVHCSYAMLRRVFGEEMREEDRQRLQIERGMLSHVPLVMAPSAAIADLASECYGYPRKAIELVAHPLDTVHFAPFGPDSMGQAAACDPVIGTEEKSVLYVGRMDANKGLYTLGEAANRFLCQLPLARLEIVGERGGAFTADAFMARLAPAVRDRVVFHGRVPHADLPAYYRRAELCVVPSRWENFPYTVVEALACGTPVVASRIGGIPEIVADGVSGCLVPPDDADALASAVIGLLRNDTQRARMGAAARERAVELCDPGRVAMHAIALYRDTLAATDRGPGRPAVNAEERGRVMRGSSPTRAAISGVEATSHRTLRLGIETANLYPSQGGVYTYFSELLIHMVQACGDNLQLTFLDVLRHRTMPMLQRDTPELPWEEEDAFLVSRHALARRLPIVPVQSLLGPWRRESRAQKVAQTIDDRVVHPTRLRMRSSRGLARWSFPVDVRAGLDLCHWSDGVFVPLPGIAHVATLFDAIPLKHPEWCGPAETLYHARKFEVLRRGATRLIAISEHTKRDAVNILGFEEQRIDVIPLAAGSRFRPPDDPAATEAVLRRHGLLGCRYILYLGNCNPHKNLVRLATAFKAAVGRMEGAAGRDAGHIGCGLQLVLVGVDSGIPDDELDRLLDVGLGPDQLRLLGRVPADDLPAIVQGALALALVSLSEGFGLPVLEAMACGTPVIASNAASLPEVAGDAALFVDPHDIGSIAAGIHRMSRDAALRRKLAGDGLLRASLYSWDRTARMTLETYDRARAELRIV